MKDLLVVDAMSTKLVKVRPSDSVLVAVKSMIKAGVGNVLVLTNGNLKGILTEKDVLAKVVALSKSPANTKVSEVMTKDVITAKPSLSIQDAARLMIDKGIRRLPIIRKGEILGIVTDTDVLRVQPGLIDVLSERLKYDKPSFADGPNSGVCENCNSYARELFRVDGVLLCNKCKRKDI